MKNINFRRETHDDVLIPMAIKFSKRMSEEEENKFEF